MTFNAFGSSPQGAVPLSTPSTINGIVRLPPVNIEIGKVVSFPSATASLNGTVVTSPFTLDSKGFYELFVETTPALIQPLTVVDLDDIVVQVNTVGFTNDRTPSFKNMVNDLPLVYASGRKALPRFSTEEYKVDICVSNPVTLELRLTRDAVVISNIGLLLAKTAGRHRSAEFTLPPGKTTTQAVLVIQSSPFVVLAQTVETVTGPVVVIPVTLPPAPVTPNPAGSLSPIANSANVDLNSYTAVGIASYSDNFMAIDRTTFTGDEAIHIAMTGVENAGTFLIDSPATPSQIASIKQVCTIKNDGPNLDAHVTSIIRHANTGETKLGKTWIIPPDNVWRDAFENWDVNPFTEKPWLSGDLGAAQYRFGLLRDTSLSTIQWQRMFVTPS